MMEEMNHGWGMGHGYYWIFGIVALAVIVWAIFRLTGGNKNPKAPE